MQNKTSATLARTQPAKIHRTTSSSDNQKTAPLLWPLVQLHLISKIMMVLDPITRLLLTVPLNGKLSQSMMSVVKYSPTQIWLIAVL